MRDANHLQSRACMVASDHSNQKMILLLILLVLLLLVLGFLTVPVRLYIDSDENRFELSHWPVVFFSISFQDFVPKPNLKIAGISINMTRKRKPGVEKKSKPQKRESGKRSKRPWSSWRFLISRVLRSFVVRNLTVDIDTGDVTTNAKLVPLLLMANGRAVHVSTNFQGRVYLHLEASNRFGKLAWIFIQFLTKK